MHRRVGVGASEFCGQVDGEGVSCDFRCEAGVACHLGVRVVLFRGKFPEDRHTARLEHHAFQFRLDRSEVVDRFAAQHVGVPVGVGIVGLGDNSVATVEGAKRVCVPQRLRLVGVAIEALGWHLSNEFPVAFVEGADALTGGVVVAPEGVRRDVVDEVAVVVEAGVKDQTNHTPLILRAVRHASQRARAIGQGFTAPVRVVGAAVHAHVGTHTTQPERHIRVLMPGLASIHTRREDLEVQVVVQEQRVGLNHTLTPIVLAASRGAIAAAPLHGAVARRNHTATDVDLGVVRGVVPPQNAVVERVEIVCL